MTEYTWYVIENGYDTDKGFKKMAYACRVANNVNLHDYFNKYTVFGDIKGYVISINACKTKKIAQNCVRAWNENAIGQGLYLFA